MNEAHENLCENIYQLTCVYGRITAISLESGISVATIQNIRRRENEDTKHSTVTALWASKSVTKTSMRAQIHSA